MYLAVPCLCTVADDLRKQLRQYTSELCHVIVEGFEMVESHPLPPSNTASAEEAPVQQKHKRRRTVCHKPVHEVT